MNTLTMQTEVACPYCASKAEVDACKGTVEITCTICTQLFVATPNRAVGNWQVGEVCQACGRWAHPNVTGCVCGAKQCSRKGRGQMEPKWLYRLESTNSALGLWYNETGEFVLTIAEIEDCKTKELPMGFDERYKQDGKDWFSSCSNVEDLTHWYSVDNARALIERGFRFSKYLATDYVEYDKETVFLKETCSSRITLSIEEIFKGSYATS